MIKMPSTLSLNVNYPDWITDFPIEFIKKMICYCYKYPLVGFGSIIFLLVIFIAALKLIIFESFQVSGFRFKLKNGKKDKKELHENPTINDLERKIGNLNHQVHELTNLNIAKSKDNTRLSKLLNEAYAKTKDIEKNEKSSDSLIIKNEELRKALNQYINTSEAIMKNISAIKEAIFYITSENKNFNELFNHIKNKDSYKFAVHELYSELQYNLLRCITHKADNVRTSIMRYNKQEDYLQIVSKLGNFNCTTGDLVLKKGEGFAGQCLIKSKIINIPDIHNLPDEPTNEVACCKIDYKPARRNNNTVSSLHVPVYVLGHAIGVINVSSPHINAFKEEDELIARLYSEEISRIWLLEKLVNLE